LNYIEKRGKSKQANVERGMRNVECVSRSSNQKIKKDERNTMSDELTKISATELVRLIRRREVSPMEVVESHLRRIEEINPTLNAIVTLAPDAIERAKEIETRIAQGENVGPLCGVPVTIKDTIATKGLRTTCGSKRLAQNIPNEDADVVARLKSAGAIIIGKTNTAELAMALECDNPLFGRTNNPRDLTKTPGGSSGGDAAAVASFLTPIGIGSDLMGSVRIPAHFCGVYGLKPTINSVSMRGHFPKATGVYSLGATIGPIARSVDDLASAFEVIAKTKDQRPKTKSQKAVFYTNDDTTPVTKETKEAVVKAAKAFSDAGFVVEEKLPPAIERGPELWKRLFMRGGLLPLKEIYEGNEADAGETVQITLKRVGAMEQSLDDFIEAWAERDELQLKLIEWMNDWPIIIAPVGAGPAFEHGTRRITVEGQSLNQIQAFSYCAVWNVFGFPVACVPVWKSKEGLPIGVQIIGRPFEENEALAAAKVIEQTIGG
jgi:Asp-tRNA(Asn)/Glu-tRNA(Gln) amidotransferase A subunit family amidase